MAEAEKSMKSIVLQADRARLVLLNFGATTCDWRVPVGAKTQPMILGFDDLAQYQSSPFYFGAIVGRVSNRIGGGGYTGPDGPVGLECNEGGSVLHGGARGLSAVYWDIQALSDSEARLSYTSPHGENGFPGEVQFEVLVSLTPDTLCYKMRAKVDRPTPISLAQHNYYNFGGTQNIWDYHLTCASHQMLEKDKTGVSTGNVRDVTDTDLDFRTPRALLDTQANGLDDHFLFTTKRGDLREVASIVSADGLGVKIHSDQDGAQIYTADGMPAMTGGLDGQSYASASGICFEPQGHPNAVNIPEFPSVMVTPETPYEQTLLIEVTGHKV
ncbi:MAG: galactose mutarotase [Cognatishimia sp.]|uniref:aldose epimerase family protein n=1 Tax=Cognatishimia sp. TaxID=2211648 RepID=UPI003B8B56CD